MVRQRLESPGRIGWPGRYLPLRVFGLSCRAGRRRPELVLSNMHKYRHGSYADHSCAGALRKINIAMKSAPTIPTDIINPCSLM